MKHITLLLVTLSCCFASFGQAPAPVTGPSNVCIGVSTLFSDTSSGGSWSVGSTAVATIDISGHLTGVTIGSTTVTYTTTGGHAVATVTVVFPPCGPSPGFSNVCAGATVAEGGCSGVWSSSNTAIATVDPATGIVGGVMPGSVTLTVTSAPGCALSGPVIVNPSPLPIFGTPSVCIGATTILGDATSSGTWSSSNNLVATVGATGGVTGASAGADTIYYTHAGCSASKTIIVNSPPVPDSVTGGGAYCAGGIGFPVGLNGSTIGVIYQLYDGGIATGAAVPGTGFPLNFGLLTAGGAYTVVAVSSATGCTGNMLGSAHITVNPLPSLFVVSGGGTYCPGSSTGFYIYLSYSEGGVNYQLYNGVTPVGGPVMGTSGVPPSFWPDTASGTYTIVATDVITGCSREMADTAVIIAASAPTISGTTSVCEYGTIPETVSGFSGGTWASGSLAIATVGATTGIVTGVTPGTSTITYTSSAGCTATKSITVSLSPPLFTGNASICSGISNDTTTLYSTAIGGAWSSSNTTVATIATATGKITGVSPGTSIITYSIFSGCTIAETVTVHPSPTVYTLIGGGSYCAGGAGSDIMLSGSDLGVNYELTSGGIPVPPGLTGTGTSLDFGLHAMSGLYVVIATNSYGCVSFMSGVDTITPAPIPTVHHVTGGGSVCSGGTGIHIGLDNSVAGTTYQLYNAGTPVGGAVAGTGAALDFGAQTIAGTYTVIATNSGGCDTAMADSAVVTVSPAPHVYAMTGGGLYCAGGTGVHVGLSGSDAGVSYQLALGAGPVGTPVPGTGTAIDMGLQTMIGDYVAIATDAATGCSSFMSGYDTVGIVSLPAVYTVTGGGGYCSGGPGASISLSSSATGVNYQLYNGSATAGPPVAGTGSTLSFGLFPAGTYKVIAANATGCTDTMAGSAIVSINSLPAVYTVTGGGSYCSGGTGVTVGLSGSAPGVNYQLMDGSATVGTPVAGTGSSFIFGLETAAGTYTVIATNAATGCTNNMAGAVTVSITPTVTPSVAATSVSGDTVCLGTSVIYTTSSVSGGGAAPSYQWYVNGVAASLGSVYSYTPANGDIVSVLLTSSALCASPASVSSPVIHMVVNPLPPISGGTSVCSGSNLTLADTSGGVWTSSNPAVATISTIGGATGVVSGVGPGSATITYTVGTGCVVSTSFTVLPLPVVSASYVAATCGGTYTLTGSGGATYSWSPPAGMSCPACAVTDVVPPATTTYVVTGTDAMGCSDTASVTVDGNRISGYISLSSAGPLEVWLIQFDPSDSSLHALDSMSTCTSGGTPYYEFNDKPAGSYMVKAFLPGGTPGASGYIPTYGVSSPHWGAATAVAHTSAADTLHINMIYGTVPPGPGFIGGLISSGAGKGTTGDPAPGMLVYLVDAASNQVLTYNYTDEHGAYSFSGLADGSYIIYPEAFAYNTTASPVINLGSDADSVGRVNFKQHTTARTITPAYIPAHVTPLTAYGTVQVFPNPTSGDLYIGWSNQETGTASVRITDVTGREVYKSAIDVSASSGQAQIAPRDLKSGIYLISIKSESMDYNNKLIVQ